jgi:hypothetical protein
MANSVRLYCQLVNQPKLFLLERAVSELQILYQTYLFRTNLKRSKSQEENISKKFSQCLCSLKSLYFRIFLNYIDQIRTKNTLRYSASKTQSIWALEKCFTPIFDALIKKFEKWNFCKIQSFARTIGLQEYQPPSPDTMHELNSFCVICSKYVRS